MGVSSTSGLRRLVLTVSVSCPWCCRGGCPRRGGASRTKSLDEALNQLFEPAANSSLERRFLWLIGVPRRQESVGR
ncbi:hypothetical protein Svir_05110 [Saccharomonospora viridis DSM 43017]|uniref:Uncharacterized protein n=1 Tax=Saccharomonospora viridis (strain ATCC 15386 / DSM 43017 / JCM 3036 / CCUG 5913 / NBRC 12207 / NCIMB 9602 / P101) TaxID=471857 RepID=C7MU57_SACVD|nr:hypothetical protein Svir_05110 [Saccharomonospora viridis DSM 43017]